MRLKELMVVGRSTNFPGSGKKKQNEETSSEHQNHPTTGKTLESRAVAVKILTSREHLSDAEGLAHETLNLARAHHSGLILLGQLIHSQNGNNILQRLVV
jgi:hypothetical protein